MRSLPSFLIATIVATGLLPHTSGAQSIRLAASTPLVAYADPVAIDGGNGVIASIFDGLTAMGRDNQVEPALALSWEITSNTSWRFQLRPNASFHDGTPVTSDIIVEYLDFMTSDGTAAFPASRYVETVASATALDPLTVEITTTMPDPILDRRLTRAKIFPVSAFKAAGRSAFGRAPIGTGPYSVDRWGRAGSSGVVLTAEPTSWRAPEQIMTAEYVILSDTTSRIQGLLSGEVDIANSIDPDSVPALEAAGFRTNTLVSPIVLALAFNNCSGDRPAASNIQVRKALNLAVDRASLADNLLSGVAPPVSQGGVSGVFGHNEDIPDVPYDPGTARDMLVKAGYRDGLDLEIAVFTGQFPSDGLIFQQVAQDWAAIGVDANIRPMAFPEFLRRSSTGDWSGFDMFASVWSHYQFGEVSDAMKRFAGLHPGKYFCAPDLHADIQTSEREMDPVAREAMLQDLMARLHELAPSVPLMPYAGINAMSPRVLTFKSKTDAILFGEMRVATDD